MSDLAHDLPLFSWSPQHKVLTFPAAKRRAFILRNARHAAGMSPAGADNWICHLIEKHRARLIRIGVEADASLADASALEKALRAEIARITGRGAA